MTAPAVCRATLTVADIGPWLGKAYGAVAGLLAARQAGPAGPPFARYHLLSDGRFEVEAGFPVSKPVEGNGDVRPSELPGGPVAVTVHTGPYGQMDPGYQALASWVEDHGGKATGDAWEVYFSDPATQPDPATWRTEIIQPYRVAATCAVRNWVIRARSACPTLTRWDRLAGGGTAAHRGRGSSGCGRGDFSPCPARPGDAYAGGSITDPAGGRDAAHTT